MVGTVERCLACEADAVGTVERRLACGADAVGTVERCLACKADAVDTHGALPRPRLRQATELAVFPKARSASSRTSPKAFGHWI